jgi:hypothetical protein
VGALDRVQDHLMRAYGAGLGHLVAVLACLAIAGGAVGLVVGDPAWPVMLVWFLAAVVLHDLVLFPLYSTADRALRSAARRPRVPVVNHVRLPLLGAGLTFLLFLPGIVGQGEPTLRAASGLDQSPYLVRWLLLGAAMAAVSALVYAIRMLLPHREQQVVDEEGEEGLPGQPEADPPARKPGTRQHKPHRERQPDALDLALRKPRDVGDQDRGEGREREQSRDGG